MTRFVFIVSTFFLLCSASQAEEKKEDLYVAMEPLVVNLTDASYVSFTPQLKLSSAEDRAYVNACVPAVRHEFIKLMMGNKPADVQTPTFISRFAQEARDLTDKVVGSGYIKGVFVTSWVVQ